MNTQKLSAFYRSVVSWPSNEGELAEAASRLADLVGAPFAAIQRSALAGIAESRAWKLGSTSAPSPLASVDAVQEFIRAHLASAESLFTSERGAAPELRSAALEVSVPPWGARPEIDRLVITNLSVDAQAQTVGGRAGRATIDYGWLILGLSRALSDNEEALILAAAQRLASLAHLASLEMGIQLRNQFLSIASHELKTPLTSIYGVLQLQERMLRLKKEESPQESRDRQASYLKMTIRQTQRLNELIDGLLDVSRIQNGRFLAEPSDTDVAALTRETISGRLSVIAQEAGVTLAVDAPEGLRAWVDPIRMEEVVTNLVMNAIRFSPEGGIVRVTLTQVDPMLHFTVSDQGPSVPTEDRERIFHPFERAQRTARFGGLGLGLFISRQIAQIHGGDVRLADALPGKGNTLEATIPLKAGATGAGQAGQRTA